MFGHLWRKCSKILPIVYLLKNSIHSDDQSHEQIQMTINKIFLTSQESQYSSLKIFAFDAQILARQITSHLDISLGRHISDRFNDGQINIRLLDSVRGQKIIILKSFDNKNINDGIMQLMLAVSCMKKSGAKSITTVIPFFPYTTPSSVSSDDIVEGRDFYTSFAADIVKMLQAMGCDQIVTLNPIISHPKGFAQSSSFISIEAAEIAVPHLIHTDIVDPVIISAKSQTQHLNQVHQLLKTFKIFDYKCSVGCFDHLNYIGQDVKDRDVLLYNNLIRTGKTLRNQIKILKQKGAKNIYCYGFHGLCTHDQFNKLINQLPIKQLIMTNTISNIHQNKKIYIISVAKLLAQTITILSQQKSLIQYRGQRQMLHYAFLQKIKQRNRASKMQEL